MKITTLLTALVLASFSAEAKKEDPRPKLEKAEFTYASGDKIVLTIKERKPVNLELFTSTGKHCIVPPEELKGITLSLLGSVQVSATSNKGTTEESVYVTILGFTDYDVIYEKTELTEFYFLFVNGIYDVDPLGSRSKQSETDKFNQRIIENSKDSIKKLTEPAG